ncbi:MFS transporter [Chengkuizengella axinellae]|uniref:MFS transporter n=1 Tax=Chengkuizengella axinellae TaxID=3064388 RepID=A0ABT9J2Y4_9BACL|nr:MFS transporter [Chengkuizengella sp. 2205SS18-9]MDP5275370.1 MFS transporter [Chengkuizengella sp. 2205SS18-9]
MSNRLSFHFLWAGQALANLGDVFYIVSMITTVYYVTGSAAFMAFVPFVIAFSRFFGGIAAPWVLDRLSLKSVLVTSQSVKTGLLLVFTIILFSGLHLENIFLLFLFASIIAFLDGWANPARNAMLPRIVDKEELVKANSFLSIVDQSVQLGGWAISGIIVAVLGNDLLIFITFMLFVASSILMSLLNDPTVTSEEDTKSKTQWESFKEGWTTIWHKPSLKGITLIDILDSIAGVVWIAAILYIYVEEVIQKSEAWWGYINATFFIGLIIGGMFSFRMEKIIKQHLYLFIMLGCLLYAGFTLWFGLLSAPWLALVISISIGISLQFKSIAQQTIVQFSADHEILPKVYSAQDAMLTFTFAVSTLLFGYLTDMLGVRSVFVIAAAITFLSSIVSIIFRKQFRRIDA